MACAKAWVYKDTKKKRVQVITIFLEKTEKKQEKNREQAYRVFLFFFDFGFFPARSFLRRVIHDFLPAATIFAWEAFDIFIHLSFT